MIIPPLPRVEEAEIPRLAERRLAWDANTQFTATCENLRRSREYADESSVK